MNRDAPGEAGELPPSPQVKIAALSSLHAQIEVLRAILRDAQQGGGFHPAEKAAGAEVAEAFAELAEAVRRLFDE